MELDDQFQLEHLYLTERKCRSCEQIKDLIDGFYLTRKGRGNLPSAYSYECKQCTIQRITEGRRSSSHKYIWEYPDW